ncbi:MAG TPA: 3TM-type holin [Polyangiaceae bacterium]|nr:3TM-type holin [Polyangiaceae bacterium]
MAPALLALLPFLSPLLTRVVDRAVEAIPDPAEKERVRQAANQELMSGLQLADAQQLVVNSDEAKSPHPFAAMWRPAAGWVCVLGFASNTLMQPYLPWFLTVFGVEGVPPVPKLDTSELYVMLFGMLGLGAYRTYEKQKGTDLRR